MCPAAARFFWENACASGTAAVGMALAANMGSRVELTLAEPGGSLRVVSDPAPGETWLYGQTRLVQTYETEI